LVSIPTNLSEARIPSTSSARICTHWDDLKQANNLHDRMIAVLKEFINDVESAGIEYTKGDWPDLFVTYKNAKRLFKAK
jgi:hypothetical protein